MCDIDKETRSLRYAQLREYGYLRGFAQRARDFTTKRFNDAIKRDMLDVEICNIIDQGKKWQRGIK
jgi:hypothetical protein